MKYVSLGRTGLTVSRLALGCMSYGDPTRTVDGSTITMPDTPENQAEYPQLSSQRRGFRVSHRANLGRVFLGGGHGARGGDRTV